MRITALTVHQEIECVRGLGERNSELLGQLLFSCANTTVLPLAGLMPVRGFNLSQLFSRSLEYGRKFCNFAEVSPKLMRFRHYLRARQILKRTRNWISLVISLKCSCLVFFSVDCIIRNTGAFTVLYVASQFKKPIKNY